MSAGRDEVREEEAEVTTAFVLAVPAVIAEASEEEAVSVCALTAVVIPAV